MFTNIQECWAYVLEAKDYDDLVKRTMQLPRWSGDWDVEPNEYRECRIINTYWVEQYQTYNQDIEDTTIEFPNFDDDTVEVYAEWLHKSDCFVVKE